jgi:hypothetical protein
VEPPRQVADKHEVFVDGPAFYESALAVGYKIIHVRLQPESQHFGYNFRYGVDEADWTEVRNHIATLFLR